MTLLLTYYKVYSVLLQICAKLSKPEGYTNLHVCSETIFGFSEVMFNNFFEIFLLIY